MLFNSYSFVLLFLPLSLAGWWLAPLGPKGRLGVLTAASFAFYGLWDWRFVGLLAASTLLDYSIGRRLAASKSPATRRCWLWTSVSINLSVLAVFKYAGFAAESVHAVAEWLQCGGRAPVWEVVLPVGISFYTFQTMSYAIDLYRGTARPAASLWHFAAYVSMFPQLVAGPIVRYSDVDAQLRSIERRIDWRQFASGITIFAAGMAQKVLLADPLASRIEPLWSDVENLQCAGAWFALVGYAMQLYFDFAGYSNMAVGLGRMLGFEFCQNFDSPYQAASIQDFWRRWHISLSHMLRDYLFIPLGGNRYGALLTLRNLMIVMVLGGIWHGAGWTFFWWGVYHGVLLSIHALWKTWGRRRLSRTLAWPLTFASVLGGWAMFRAASWHEAETTYRALFGLNGVESSPLAAIGGASSLALLSSLVMIVAFLPNLWRIRYPLNATTGALAAVVLTACLLRFDTASPFLYFQF